MTEHSSTLGHVDLSQLDPVGFTANTLEALLQAVPMGVIWESLEGGILGANAAFCRLVGYTQAQLRYLDRRAIAHPEDFAREVQALQHMMAEGGRQLSFSKRFITRNGSIAWTEVVVSLVGDPETEHCYFLSFVTDLSDRHRVEQEIQQRRQREALLNEISAKIRSSLDLETILNTAVDRLRHALSADRVLIYRVNTEGGGQCLAESVERPYPELLGQFFGTDCLPLSYLDAYRQGRVWTVANLATEPLADCHRTMLVQAQVRGIMAIAIQQPTLNHLLASSPPRHIQPALAEAPQGVPLMPWGLLIVHQCRSGRVWTEDDHQLLQAVANQVSIALEHTSLLHQLRAYTTELEERVDQRTQSLQQALRFEQLIHHLTETLRQEMNEDQMLKAAAEGLVDVLQTEGCYASLYNDAQHLLEVRYVYCSQPEVYQAGRLPKVGQQHALQTWPQSCQDCLLTGQTCLQRPSTSGSEWQCTLERSSGSTCDRTQSQSVAFQSASPHGDRSLRQGLLALTDTQLIAPIWEDHKLIGTLCLFQQQPRQFQAAEIKLAEQVASQCAIAIRQARLYREEHQQRLSAQHLRQFINQSTDIFVEYDTRLRYVSINPAGCAALGLSPEQIVGKTNRELLGVAAEDLELLVRQALETNTKIFVNHEVVWPSGTRVYDSIFTPIADPDGVVHRAIGFCRDVTEVKRQWQLLEQQNQELEAATRLKEEFMATTSHELRTPLTAILGFSNVLLQEFFGELNAKQKDYLSRIHGSGQHLLDLINDILDLSRLEANRLDLEPQLIFIEDLCRNVMSFVYEQAQKKQLRLEADISPDLEYVVADARRLKQMLLNLLTNAIKFTPEGGQVGLKIGYAPETDPVHMSRILHFTVWDTGVGIAEADQARLFSPFTQIDSSLARYHEGTGLGLVITRKLAELHGGTVLLESKPGQGSKFTLALPENSQLEMVSSTYYPISPSAT